MAKAQAFGDKVKGKIKTHKKMVKYILPIMKKDGTGIRFKEGMLSVPESKDYAEYVKEKLPELLNS